MNAERHMYNIKKDWGEFEKFDLKIYFFTVERVWPNCRAIPDALVYNVTADLHAEEIPRQSLSEDYLEVSL